VEGDISKFGTGIGECGTEKQDAETRGYRGLEWRLGVLESEKLQFRVFRDLREMFIRSEEVTMMRDRC